MNLYTYLLCLLLPLAGCSQNEHPMTWSNNLLGYDPSCQTLTTNFMFVNDLTQDKETFQWRFEKDQIHKGEETIKGFWIDNATFYAMDQKKYYRRTAYGVHYFDRPLDGKSFAMGNIYFKTKNDPSTQKDFGLLQSEAEMRQMLEDTVFVIHTFPAQTMFPERKPTLAGSYCTFVIDIKNKTIKQYSRATSDHTVANERYDKLENLVAHYRVLEDWKMSTGNGVRSREVYGMKLFDEIQKQPSSMSFMVDLYYDRILFANLQNKSTGAFYIAL